MPYDGSKPLYDGLFIAPFKRAFADTRELGDVGFLIPLNVPKKVGFTHGFRSNGIHV
jgi:hypothetical protein